MEEQALVLKRLLVRLGSEEAEGEDGLAEEFSRLKMQSIQYRNDNTFPTTAALIKDNGKKNRYKDIVPFDHTRVKLSLNTSKNEDDYINASFIKGVSGSRAYIATQGPLPHTLLDFLRMIWEYKVQVVVMACREFEMGRKKCERYWPEARADPFVCGPFAIDCDHEENKGDYRTRKLRITYQNCGRALHQLHYYNWPDHGVPDTIPPILEMLQEMRVCQDHDDIPICIHCSAGCGRTGALCVIDYTWNLMKRQAIPPDFSIYDLVQDMRTQRPSVVQTKEQYELVYKTVKFLFERYLQSFDSPACQSKVQRASSPSPVASGNDQPVLSEAASESALIQPDPDAQCQRVAPAEAELGPLPSAREKVLEDHRWKEGREERQQPQALPRHSHPPRPPSPDYLPRAAEQLVAPAPIPASRTRDEEGEEEVVEEEEGMEEEVAGEPPPKPALPRLSTTCLTVEDPYFGGPERTSLPEELLGEHWMAEAVGTYILNTPTVALPAADAPVQDHPQSSLKLDVVIPPNAAAPAVREAGGSPPSPVPPLPERTPESFEFAHDEARGERLTSSQSVGLNRVGTSSEWCCESLSPPAALHEVKSWNRSKSLKVSMTFNAPPTSCSAVRSNRGSSHLPPPPPPPPSTAFGQPEGNILQEDLNPPLPQRTPESFVLASEGVDENSSAQLQMPGLGPRIGTSSEWAGSPQPKRFLDFVFMNRSKSVRAKTSRQVVQQPAGSASTERLEDQTAYATNGKVMPRTRSLKFFKSRAKPVTPSVPPQPGQQAPPTNGASGSGFKFGFGNRFNKPKGPRSYPDPWM